VPIREGSVPVLFKPMRVVQKVVIRPGIELLKTPDSRLSEETAEGKILPEFKTEPGFAIH